LKLPLTTEEHAFYNLYLTGREKDMLKGAAWPSLW
jgi:hypothetical protein